jgi:hypothetical protein
MSTIIKHAERVTEVRYTLAFDWNRMNSGGFSFLCDKTGHVNTDLLYPAARANYDACITGAYDVTPARIEREIISYTSYAEVRCDCGKVIFLTDPLNNDCECGRSYNLFGQPVNHYRPCYFNEDY